MRFDVTLPRHRTLRRWLSEASFDGSQSAASRESMTGCEWHTARERLRDLGHRCPKWANTATPSRLTDEKCQPFFRPSPGSNRLLLHSSPSRRSRTWSRTAAACHNNCHNCAPFGRARRLSARPHALQPVEFGGVVFRRPHVLRVVLAEGAVRDTRLLATELVPARCLA